MDWTDEEAKAALKAALDADTTDEVCITDSSVKAIMTRAVELAAARCGTMTGDRLADLMSEVPSQEWVDEVMAHISALGARNALLKERLSAAEEGNRELVRRAQQAEATADMDRKEVAQKQRALRKAWDDRDEWRERAEVAEASCATLSAAGQVPSERETRMPSLAHPHFGSYPCSPTCTNDDAATTSPESLAAGYVLPDDTATLFEARSEAPTHPAEVARREGFNEGAEAMRAACLEAVQAVLGRHGYSKSGVAADVKAAIEGAAS